MKDLSAFIASSSQSSPVWALLSALCHGTITVDHTGKVLWLSPKYAQLMALSNPEQVIGKPIEQVLPQSQLPRVLKTGKPLLADLMEINGHWCFVSRLPIFDDNEQVIGAIGFVYSDDLDSLEPLFEKYARLQRHQSAGQSKRLSRYTLDDVIGQSPVTQQLKRQAQRAAQLDTTVLLTGETGTGKELLAQGIHQASHRHLGPFVGINMAALPEALVESELFGTAPGAYSGADRKKRLGKVQLADGGTLFLDEISEMPLASQAKLLRVLQEREVEALGSNQLVRVDVRIIAATSQDLATLVNQGKFRADLYYRIQVLPVHLPPLRQRPQDILDLSSHFLTQIQQTSGLPALPLSPEAQAWLCQHPWPGNIRELRNRLERASVLCESSTISPNDLGAEDSLLQQPQPTTPEAVTPTPSTTPNEPAVDKPLGLKDTLSHVQKQTLLNALSRAKGNKSLAAKQLGISRSTLYDQLKKCRINPTD